MKVKIKPEKDNKALGSRVKELEEQLARALADYDNLRKRVEKEKQDYESTANIRLIGKILIIYDMLINAQKHLNDSGLAITLEEFKRILNEEGVEEIKADTNLAFNAQLHEAVDIVENKDSNLTGKIANILLSGWKFKEGSVIRCAKVKVYGKNNRN